MLTVYVGQTPGRPRLAMIISALCLGLATLAGAAFVSRARRIADLQRKSIPNWPSALKVPSGWVEAAGVSVPQGFDAALTDPDSQFDGFGHRLLLARLDYGAVTAPEQVLENVLMALSQQGPIIDATQFGPDQPMPFGVFPGGLLQSIVRGKDRFHAVRTRYGYAPDGVVRVVVLVGDPHDGPKDSALLSAIVSSTDYPDASFVDSPSKLSYQPGMFMDIDGEGRFVNAPPPTASSIRIFAQPESNGPWVIDVHRLWPDEQRSPQTLVRAFFKTLLQDPNPHLVPSPSRGESREIHAMTHSDSDCYQLHSRVSAVTLDGQTLLIVGRGGSETSEQIERVARRIASTATLAGESAPRNVRAAQRRGAEVLEGIVPKAFSIAGKDRRTEWRIARRRGEAIGFSFLQYEPASDEGFDYTLNRHTYIVLNTGFESQTNESVHLVANGRSFSWKLDREHGSASRRHRTECAAQQQTETGAVVQTLTFDKKPFKGRLDCPEHFANPGVAESAYSRIALGNSPQPVLLRELTDYDPTLLQSVLCMPLGKQSVVTADGDVQAYGVLIQKDTSPGGIMEYYDPTGQWVQSVGADGTCWSLSSEAEVLEKFPEEMQNVFSLIGS